MKKAIFGGSFNPVHNGHINSVKTVQQKMAMDEVIIVPTFRSPLKPYITEVTPQERMEMLKIAFSGHKAISFESFEIDSEGPSYTAETLRYLQRINKEDEFYLVIGMDQLEQFDQWKSFAEIISLCHLVVTSRPDTVWQGMDSLPAAVQEFVVDFNKECLELSTGKSIFFVQLEDMDISSTEVRNLLEEGEEVTGLLTPEVQTYIEKHQLYKAKTKKIDDYEEFTRFCGQCLFDKKGINVRAFDVRNINQPAEFNLVVSGTSTRHSISLAENLIKSVRDQFKLKPQGVEGMSEGRWIVIDYGSLIIHVFYDYLREAYRMEELWKEGKDMCLIDEAPQAD